MSIASNKNPQKIINTLASLGPLNKWDLMKKTGLKYPRIHETIKRLHQEGYVKDLAKKKRSKKGMLVRLWYLTFKGVLEYSRSNLIKMAPPRIVMKKNRVTVIKTKKAWEDYNVKINSFFDLLQTSSKILNYPIFNEINWFLERFNISILYFLFYNSSLRVLARHSSNNFSIIIKDIKKQLNPLESEKKLFRKIPSLRFYIIEVIAEEKRKVEIDRLSEITNLIKILESSISTMIETEDTWLRQKFGELFFSLMLQFSRQIKGKTNNQELNKFAKKLLEKKKKELIPLKKISTFFKRH